MNAFDQPAVARSDASLAELDEAIDHAAQLAWHLGYTEGGSADARTLFSRLGALRAELETLRRSNRVAAPANVAPIWSRLIGPQ